MIFCAKNTKNCCSSNDFKSFYREKKGDEKLHLNAAVVIPYPVENIVTCKVLLKNSIRTQKKNAFIVYSILIFSFHLICENREFQSGTSILYLAKKYGFYEPSLA